MKQYSLKISSKNDESLKKFLSFFFNRLKTKFNIIQKVTAAKKHKKVITILKSPHVNKTAQEQFEMRIFSKHLLIKSFYLEKNLIFLKKILNRLFQDISINLEFITDKNQIFKNSLLVCYPDNFKLFTDKLHGKNINRNRQKNRSKAVSLKKNLLFNLAKLLTTMSIFGETVASKRLDK